MQSNTVSQVLSLFSDAYSVASLCTALTVCVINNDPGNLSKSKKLSFCVVSKLKQYRPAVAINPKTP